MIRKKILIADDESLIRNFLKETLSRKGYDISLAENGQMAIDLLKKEEFDFVITDMKMPIKSGMEVLQMAKKIDPSITVIIMTAFASVENTVEAMNKGAFNYLLKPFSAETIETIIKKANEHRSLVKENAYLRKEIYPSFSMVANSEGMKKILVDIKKIAKSNASVFITGESGTGKEVIAQIIHSHSKRKNKPFIKVNCAAIPDTLIESEFFGHEKGAFTGANQKKEGRFEIANGGSLLLDEVTEIPVSLQPKLLRAIQEQEIERVGGIKTIHFDARFISTSNRNIKEAIQNKLLREDLFYRLNVVPICIPPLRERKKDIIPLANYFLQKFCLENHVLEKTISDKTKEKLLDYSWPGNVRELSNIIERTVVLDQGPIVEEEHILLDNAFKKEKKKFQPNLFDETKFSLPVGISLAELEKRLILETYRAENNNCSRTAKTLKINIRTLRNKLKAYKEKDGSIN
jgi:two-component system response regulator AtoC